MSFLIIWLFFLPVPLHIVCQVRGKHKYPNPLKKLSYCLHNENNKEKINLEKYFILEGLYYIVTKIVHLPIPLKF